MRYLQTYKLFESVNDDAYEKWIKIEDDYDRGLREVRDEYLKGVSDCLHDLTDIYDFTSKSIIRDYSKSDDEYWKFIGNLISEFRFNVPLNSVDDFFETLIEVDETVKSHISEYRRITIENVYFMNGSDVIFNITKSGIYSIEDVRKKVSEELERYISRKYNIQYLKITIQI